jgi:AraC family transcriptional regulator of arabinose operon
MLIAAGDQEFAATHAFSRVGAFPYWGLELTCSGRMLRRMGGRGRFREQPNDALILTPPDTPYALAGAEPGRELWLLFRPRQEWLSLLRWPGSAFGVPVLRLADSTEAVTLLAEISSCFHADGHIPQLTAVNALERLLLRAAALVAAAAGDQAASDSRIAAAVRIMRQRPEAAHTVASLAEVAGLSPSRFAHRFREDIGQSPMALLETLRLDEAERLLLRTDLSIKQIAAATGFGAASYLSTRFRRRHGRPPALWRRRPSVDY